MKYDVGSLTVIYQHIPILIYAGLQEQAHHAFHKISTVHLTNMYGSETCEEQTLQSKTEHTICVEYKILGSSVTTDIDVEHISDVFGCYVNPHSQSLGTV